MPDESLEGRLSNLLAVTDVRLTRLDVDDLLVEVLERLRAILEVDTAAVLLRQHDHDDYLVARAACGLEDEVRQGVRVPIGIGFAGTIAASREPVILDRVDSTTVANPVLWEKGIVRMVGVPLLVASKLLGVLHVGRLENRSFTQHDVALLEVAGERIAAAVQTRRLAVESAAGAMLERELLPSRLPVLPGLQLSARYAPAEDRSIGGDWYDAFVLPSGRLWALIGDVAGHGLGSAVMVSRVRSAIRSYALLGGDASEVLAMTNRKLLHFENAAMVTVLCAVAEPPFVRFALSTAGHLPPVLATPEGTELVTVLPGPPLGAVPEAQYGSTTVDLPADSTLLLYTDGLIERRGEDLGVGLDRLCSAVVNTPPEQVCRDVMLRLVGSTSTVDDVALLAIGRGALPQVGPGGDALVGEWHLPPDPSSVAQARSVTLRAVGDIPASALGALELLVSELATNSVVHAASEFTVRVFRGPGRVRVECSDTGVGHVELYEADPGDTHGRGIFFVQRLADEWGVRSDEPGPGKTVWFVLDVDRRPHTRPDSSVGSELQPAVLELVGEIDLARSDEIVTRGERLLAESAAEQPVVVDLARVRFIDSSGLSALLRLRRLALARGRSISLRDVPPFVTKLLSLSGIDQVLPPE